MRDVGEVQGAGIPQAEEGIEPCEGEALEPGGCVVRGSEAGGVREGKLGRSAGTVVVEGLQEGL